MSNVKQDLEIDLNHFRRLAGIPIKEGAPEVISFTFTELCELAAEVAEKQKQQNETYSFCDTLINEYDQSLNMTEAPSKIEAWVCEDSPLTINDIMFGPIKGDKKFESFTCSSMLISDPKYLEKLLWR